MASEDVNEAPSWLTDDKPSTPAAAAPAPATPAVAGPVATAVAVNTAPAAGPANPEDLAGKSHSLVFDSTLFDIKMLIRN